MKLYSNSFSPRCRKVYAVASALGTELDNQTLDFRAGEHKTPQYLALNPNGKVPTLVDDGTTLWESNAILCYLADKKDGKLWPRASERYDVLRWLFWETSHLSPAIGKIFGELFFNAANPNQAIIDKGMKEFANCASALEGTLQNQRYLCGDDLTIADYAVAVWLGYDKAFNLPVADYKQVQRWKDAVYNAPGGELLIAPTQF